jgi:hypothetical protein
MLMREGRPSLEARPTYAPVLRITEARPAAA